MSSVPRTEVSRIPAKDLTDHEIRFVASEYKCSEWAVRNAISEVLAARLAICDSSPLILFEITWLFAVPVALGGYPACRIRLSPAGQLCWESARRPVERGS